jgi:REP element-mobilizing transposase RayT
MRVPKGRLKNRMSYLSSYFHCVFSTKERRPFLTPEFRERLWPFIGGIARQNKMIAISIGGVEDHVHLLLSLPSTLAISKAMQLIKGGSSKWVHETFHEYRLFGWQEKYGAFSVSVSQLDKIIEYIKNQEAHHRKQTFQQEFVALLKKHRIEFDERYLWD